MREIVKATAKHFGVSRAALYSEEQSRKFSWPRQVAMMLCRDLGGRSYPEIGNHFQGRDHTTAMHACRAVGARVLTDDELVCDMIAVAAIASGLSIDRNRREQEWALALHARQPMVALDPENELVAPTPEPSPEAFEVVTRTVPWEQEMGSRRVMVPAGRYNYFAKLRPRPTLLPSALSQPTKAQLMGRRA